jgi:non-homologous end joining protein Ku
MVGAPGLEPGTVCWYSEKRYYIVPREEIGQDSFAGIRDAMNRAGSQA